MVDQPARLPSSVNDAVWPLSWSAEKPDWLSLSSNNGRLLTVSTDETSVRFVAFKGRRVVDWATVELNGSGSFTLPPSMAEYSGRLGRQLADLPFYTSLTRFLAKPEVGKRFIGPVVLAETAKVIPFDQSEVDTAWQEVQGNNGLEIMVTATPKREIDAQIDLMSVVGVRPAGMYSKSAALALAAGLPNAVVANLTATGADLILVRNDVARTVHQVGLPPREATDEYAAVLAQAIDELTTFELAGLGHSNATEIESIVLTGALPTGAALYRSVRSALGDRLRHVAQRVDHPNDFPADVYAANLGLALADWERLRPRWSKRPEVNSLVMDLLPERHRATIVPRKLTRMVALAAGLAIMSTLAIFASGQAQTTVEGLDREVRLLERQAQLAAIDAAKFNKLQLTIETVENQINALSNERAINHGQVASVIERLGHLTIDSPIRRVNVLTLDLGQGEAKITGTTTSVTQALEYAEALRNTGLFNEVVISSVTSSGGPSATGAPLMSFNLSASYNERER